MLVKALRIIACPYGTFQPGEVAELPDKMARALVSIGAAIAMDTEQPDVKAVEPIEVAVVAPPEVTVSKRGRKRVK